VLALAKLQRKQPQSPEQGIAFLLLERNLRAHALCLCFWDLELAVWLQAAGRGGGAALLPLLLRQAAKRMQKVKRKTGCPWRLQNSRHYRGLCASPAREVHARGEPGRPTGLIRMPAAEGQVGVAQHPPLVPPPARGVPGLAAARPPGGRYSLLATQVG
jgi:hypothetical protein